MGGGAGLLMVGRDRELERVTGLLDEARALLEAAAVTGNSSSAGVVARMLAPDTAA